MAVTDQIAADAERAAERLHCDHCGDRIGVYERHSWRAPDGTVATSTELREAGREPGAGWRPYHTACVAAAF
jgi:hypothetical protein